MRLKRSFLAIGLSFGFCLISMESPPKTDNDSLTHFYKLIEDGNLENIKASINMHHESLNEFLFKALKACQFECAEFFFTRGAQLDTLRPTSQHNLRSFYESFSKGTALKTARWLLAHGADPDFHSPGKATPLAELCSTKFDDNLIFTEAQLLCEYGANPNTCNRFGPCLREIIIHGGNIKHKIKMIVQLIKAGSGINAKDFRGQTPLHRAVIHMPEIVPYLLNKGAQKHIQGGNGRKAIDLAKNNPDLYAMLASDLLPPMPQEALEAERAINKLKIKLA